MIDASKSESVGGKSQVSNKPNPRTKSNDRSGGSVKPTTKSSIKPVSRGDQAAFKFFSYDHVKLDRAVRDVMDAALSGGAEVAGPTPLPSARGTRRLCIQKSPHVYGASKEHYKRVMHKRLLSIKNYSMVAGTLSTLGLPAGVYVQAFHKSRPARNEVKP